jgi:hypothetical protein
MPSSVTAKEPQEKAYIHIFQHFTLRLALKLPLTFPRPPTNMCAAANDEPRHNSANLLNE